MNGIGITPDVSAVTLRVEGDGVAWIVFDGAGKLNILKSGVLMRLNDVLGEVEQGIADRRIKAVIIRSGKEGSFIAGADIDEIAGVTDPAEGAEKARLGQSIFTRIEKLRAPTIAAIDGVCLGGGTEMILACGYRLASDRKETRIGLPEIMLGILPGFGGTTRLPRLVGLSNALPIILTGKPVDAKKAERIGLIDERVPPPALYPRAHDVALAFIAGKPPVKKKKRPVTTRLLDQTALGHQLVLKQARKQVMKETKGHYPAPLKVLDIINKMLGANVEESLAIEARALGELIVTDVSKNLIHVFRLNEAAKKSPVAAAPRRVERVAVLGAGVMGGGIAQLLAYRGFAVRMKDIKPEAIGLGLKHAWDAFSKQVKRRRLERREAQKMMQRIAPTLDYSGFGTVELVIEAVIEKVDVKKAVLKEVEGKAAANTIITSNTSSLSISEMQTALARPTDFCGMHFFNPVERMPLVEIIRGRQTSDEAIATVHAVARKLEKTPVLVNDGAGFLVNRILAPYLNEAGWLLADGATIESVDKALANFGMPMGPIRLLDEVGLDVSRHAGRVMYEAFGERLRPAPPLEAMEKSKRLGKKGGVGFYKYEDGKEKEIDQSVYAELGLKPGRQVSEKDIQQRAVFVMINEAARILEDGIVATPGDVDLGMIMGTGFPPFRGGLLRYADTLGLRSIVNELERYQKELGERFAPAPLLKRKADAGETFYGAR
ncbi:MAG TPA: 3-hydroxyacyl-CoA dehydrogenase NAD-binding domain-containing protein [Longimicrobiales bacterium]